MLETISRRLTKKGMPHFACPDKSPLLELERSKGLGEKSTVYYRAVNRYWKLGRNDFRLRNDKFIKSKIWAYSK